MPYSTEIEILTAIARTRDEDHKLISARPFLGNQSLATFYGLVCLDKPFRLPLEERISIARELRRLGFTRYNWEREDETGQIVRHKSIRLRDI